MSAFVPVHCAAFQPPESRAEEGPAAVSKGQAFSLVALVIIGWAVVLAPLFLHVAG